MDVPKKVGIGFGNALIIVDHNRLFSVEGRHSACHGNPVIIMRIYHIPNRFTSVYFHPVT